MNGWIETQLEKAGWIRFLIFFALVGAYSVWAFVLPGPWAQLVAATSSDGVAPVLPELMFGYPAGEPAASFQKLQGLKDQYMLFLIIDLGAVLLSLMMVTSGVALGLRRYNLQDSFLRYLLLLPVVHFFAEATENALLAAMVADVMSPEGLMVTIQQSATSMKFIADGVNSLALVIAIVASIGAFATKPFRKKSRETAAV